MKTIQVVLEEDLLREADREARRRKVNRSALLRIALREHLRRESMRQMEEAERLAYQRHPQESGEVEAWAKIAVWPEA